MLRATLNRALDTALRIGYRVQEAGRPRSGPTLLLLGHMRSGSTVLAHILASNLAIVGYGETHLRYRDERSLVELRRDVHATLRRSRLSDGYAFDKVLHDEYIEDPALLRRADVRCLFLVREPRAALASMIRQFPEWFTGTPLPEAELERRASDYFCARLARLAVLAREVGDPGRAVVITHADLMERTAECFARIETLLDLRAPLTERYDVHWTTGVPGKGDPSEHIKKGYLDRTLRPPEVALSLAARDRATAAYSACLAELRARCTPVDADVE